jgi:uncharacterized protein YkwD
MKTRLLLVLSLFVFVISCKKDSTAPEGNPDETPPAPTIVYNINKDLMLQLINDARTKGCTCGSTVMPPVAAVTWNDQLAKAAYDHSKDMKDNGYFSHTGKNGSSPGDRIKAAGYMWKTYGENIANGYSTEQQVMTAWLASEGHCKNIMNASFKEFGAGKEGSYWTQVFGAK